MKQGTSKQKGNSFEIQICRRLTKWITEKERPEIFWRTASSGAKATMSKKVGYETKMHGDIMAVDPKGAFLTDNIYIECKHYKAVMIEPLLERKGILFNWLHKLMVEADEVGKQFWLIFKGNYKMPLIALEKSMVGDLEDIVGAPRLFVQIDTATLCWSPIQYQNIVVCRFDWFLEWANARAVETILLK